MGSGVLNSGGFGPGGGRLFHHSYIGSEVDGYGASYGSSPANYSTDDPASARYGNPSIIPLLGGSGGAGTTIVETLAASSGAGGGGALLIACQNQIEVSSGKILANGGNTTPNNIGDRNESGSGSGGGIRLVCDSLLGNGGQLRAVGGVSANSPLYAGGVGRIRLERVSNVNTLDVQPAPSTVNLETSTTALLWPPTGSPEVRVLSIGGAPAPTDPRVSFGSYSPDVALPLTTSTTVMVETVNVEQASVVNVRITPRSGSWVTEKNAQNQDVAVRKGEPVDVNAVVDTVVSTNPLTIRWRATVPTTMGYSAVQARVIRP